MTRRDVLSLALLTVLTCAVFWQGLAGQFVWDDLSLIVNNATLQDSNRLGELLTTGFWNISSSKTGLSETYTHVYRPVFTFALFVQHRLFGLDPRGFHAVSLALHLAIVALVFGLLRRTYGEGTGGWLGALAGATLFAIHPSRAESVTWISGSTELWMGLLVIGGYSIWVARPRRPVAASMLFGLALFAKETAIVVPIVLLVDMYGRQGAVNWKRWGAMVGIFSLFVVARFAWMPLPPGATADLSGMPRRVVGSLGHYIQATLWPWHPLLERGFRYTDCSGTLAVPLPTLVVGGLAITALALLCLRWRTVHTKPWSMGIAWFFLFLLPVLNVIDLHAHGLASDRFLYVPLFGVSSSAAFGVSRAWQAKPAWRTLVLLAFAALIAACAVSTRDHVAHFQDSATLWRYEADQNPRNLYALELVAVQESTRNPVGAISLFQRGYHLAIETCNTALGARFALLSTRRLVGMVADTDQERLVKLREFYDRAVATHRLDMAWPGMTLDITLPASMAATILKDVALVGIPHVAVTMRTLELGRAEEMIGRILASDPDHDGAWLLLARIQARRGRFVDAERSLEEARKRAPNNPAIAELARTLSQVIEIAATPAKDERARVIRDAQINVMLQAPEAARRLLQPELERHPSNPALVLAYVRTMIADRRFDLANAAVDHAELVAPEKAEEWQLVREALQASEAALRDPTVVREPR
jgi:tetratricopeptide (TPR) repeat protein